MKKKIKAAKKSNGSKPAKAAQPVKLGKVGKVVKKSLSLTPAAWKAIETAAKREAKRTRSEPNFSSTASELVLAGAN